MLFVERYLEPDPRRHARMVFEYWIRCRGWSSVAEEKLEKATPQENGNEKQETRRIYFLVSFWESNWNLAMESANYSLSLSLSNYIYISINYTHRQGADTCPKSR